MTKIKSTLTRQDAKLVTGADLLFATAARLGVGICFANPGTTELELVRALDRQTRIRPVLGLFEGVCTAAADGYARMSGSPAITILHLGPGLANGLAYLHDAKRAFTPVVNIVGDHPTWHCQNDPALNSDIAGMASTVSVAVETAYRAEDVPELLARLYDKAVQTRGVVTLILPTDVQAAVVGDRQVFRRQQCLKDFRALAPRHAAALLEGGPSAALLLGGAALSEAGLKAGARIAARTGCRLLSERQPGWSERGAHLPDVERLGYFPEHVMPQFEGLASTVLAGALEPVMFFAWGNPAPTHPIPLGTTIFSLASPGEDVVGALEALAEQVGVTEPVVVEERQRPVVPADGPLTARTIALVLAALQPDGAIIVDEGVTTSRDYWNISAAAPPHVYLGNRGGAIGQGIPLAVGAALACPDRPVIVFQADGAAMYTLQALWTQAREKLSVTTLICSNRAYAVLKQELGRTGADLEGTVARGMTDLTNPAIDWVALASGMGVPGSIAATVHQFEGALKAALEEPGPHLIQLELD